MTAAIDADRRQLAAYLTHHGPTHGNPLRAALKWGLSRFWDVVYGPSDRWFLITSDGWSLTDQGQREAAGADVPSMATSDGR